MRFTFPREARFSATAPVSLKKVALKSIKKTVKKKAPFWTPKAPQKWPKSSLKTDKNGIQNGPAALATKNIKKVQKVTDIRQAEHENHQKSSGFIRFFWNAIFIN